MFSRRNTGGNRRKGHRTPHTKGDSTGLGDESDRLNVHVGSRLKGPWGSTPTPAEAPQVKNKKKEDSLFMQGARKTRGNRKTFVNEKALEILRRTSFQEKSFPQTRRVNEQQEGSLVNIVQRGEN